MALAVLGDRSQDRRHLEGSMAALLGERTVAAIAHRLRTAHDADRFGVVDDGRITELGSTTELLEARSVCRLLGPHPGS